MERLFFDVVNLSITASWVIGVVLLLRLVLRPAPKKYVCLLWLVVLFRLLCPVTVETAFSLVPQHAAIQPEIVYTTPQVASQSEAVNQIADKTVNPVLQHHSAPNPAGSVNPLQVYVFLAARLWVLGIVVLCGYTLVSWFKLRRQLGEAVPDGEGVYLCDAITSPFVFGIMRPRIYLPFGLEEDERRWVLLHERSHIVRKDFLLKPLFWLAVVLHWMNPLVWAAWHFYSRDVELACDERAIGSLDDNQKWCYSNTLLQLAVQKTAWSCPVAFGNNSVKQRIGHVLRYKQAAVGVVAVAVAVVVMMMAALGANPVQVYQLGDLRPGVEEQAGEIDRLYLQWGSVQVEIVEPSAVEAARAMVADTTVQLVGKPRWNGRSYGAARCNMIIFGDDEAPDWCYIVQLNGDCTEIAPEEELCAHLRVKAPAALRNFLAQYGRAACEQLRDTTFLADLNHDGVKEPLVVNPELECVSAYTADDQVLLIKNWMSGDTGFDSYHLCRIDGQDYVLEYCVRCLDSPIEPASMAWYLREYDSKGNARLVQQDQVEFSLDFAKQNFDPQALYDFLQRLNGILDDSILLYSQEGSQRPWYSTAEKPCRYRAEDYLSWLPELADGEAEGDGLLQRLEQLKDSSQYDLSRGQLQQWLQDHRGLSWRDYQLRQPETVTIGDKECVAFRLYERGGRDSLGTYAVSAQNPKGAGDQQRGHQYYQQQGEAWQLLEDTSRKLQA